MRQTLVDTLAALGSILGTAITVIGIVGRFLVALSSLLRPVKHGKERRHHHRRKDDHNG